MNEFKFKLKLTLATYVWSFGCLEINNLQSHDARCRCSNGYQHHFIIQSIVVIIKINRGKKNSLHHSTMGVQCGPHIAHRWYSTIGWMTNFSLGVPLRSFRVGWMARRWTAFITVHFPVRRPVWANGWHLDCGGGVGDCNKCGIAIIIIIINNIAAARYLSGQRGFLFCTLLMCTCAHIWECQVMH